jgi:hypothetical protein
MPGAAIKAGIQTSKVNVPSMAASTVAASCGKIGDQHADSARHLPDTGQMVCMVYPAKNELFSHRKYAISTEIIPEKREVLMQYSVQRKRNLSEKKAESKPARGSATRLTSGD